MTSDIEWREPPYTRTGAGTWLVRYVQPLPAGKALADDSRGGRVPGAPAEADQWVEAVEGALNESQRMLWQLRWKHPATAPCLSLSGKEAKKVTYAPTWPIADPGRRWASIPTPGRCHPVLRSMPVS